MRGIALEHAVTHLSLRILDKQPSLRALHEHNEHDDHDRQRQNGENERGGERAGAAQFQRTGESARQTGDNASEDDKRYTIADAARGDLFTQPHQEDRAADQCDYSRNSEEPARIGDDVCTRFKADSDTIGLQSPQQNSAVARVLVDDLAALLPFLLQLLERRHHRCHELNDDRGGDVGHDAERHDCQPLDRAARDHVEQAEHAAGLVVERLRVGFRIDAGQRDIGGKPVNKQRTQREPDALLEFLGLGEGREVEIGGKLFCG